MFIHSRQTPVFFILNLGHKVIELVSVFSEWGKQNAFQSSKRQINQHCFNGKF